MVSDLRRRLWWATACGCVVGALAWTYGRVLYDLAATWFSDANYSHGVIVAPAAAYIAWTRRAHLSSKNRQGSWIGLLVLLASLLALLLGTAGVEFFVMRLSLLGAVSGIALFLFGAQSVRALLFPFGLVLLTIPLPPVLFNQVTFPLQLLATRFGVAILHAVGIPVLREGNVIVLARTTLEVTEACSGIRSLMSLFALATLYAYFAIPDPAARIGVVAVSVPVAIVSNGFRVAGTGITAQYIGPAVANGFFHTFSGWIVFVSSFALLVGAGTVIERLTVCASRSSHTP
jgi:exosortase